MNKMANKATLLAIAFIVSIPLGLSAQDEGFYPYSFARLSYVNGTVFVQRASDLGYEQGEVNLALVQGDKMGTESGQAEVHFGRRNYLRLDDNTRVEFALLPSEGDERIRLHLTEGRVYLRVSQLAVDKGIEVHTPDASFYVLEEGLYRIEVRPEGETRALAREGSLEAAAESGSVLVQSGETVTAAGGRLLNEPEYGYSREDGFDTWNESRDSLLVARSGRRYLPTEIEEYEEELEDNGSWVYERPYGYVWVPRVTYVDWRPYLYGRWVWYPVIGWTWVSSEPWGWSVYHYGRWHWRFGLGWYWIPRHHWGPAWVHWWYDGGHIGWCPLSWYNRPIVIVNNHFYDRYYDRYFPAHNRAMTIVRRDQLQDRQLARRQLAAADRDRIGRVELKRDQPSLRPVVDNGRPQAIAAKRALEPRSAVRSEVRRVAPSSSLSASRLRSREASPSDRARVRDGSADPSGRGGGAARPSLRPSSGSGQGGLSGERGASSEGRAIRSFPSRRDAATSDRSGSALDRRSASGATGRESAGRSGDRPAQISRSDGRGSATPQPRAVREPQRSSTGSEARGSDAKGSGSSVTKKSETVKKYPSSAGRSVSQVPSRTSVNRSSSARPSAAVTSRSSASRSSAPSYTRPSATRSASSSRSRISSAAPSRSSGSPSRTVGSSRPSGPSSSGRSVAAPRASSSSRARVSSTAPSRSGGSSGSVRSSSSGRSSSSSARSSGSSSSSKSGSVKRKH
jgi:hypothetical protein